ncbi:MAG: hypothetical protein QXH99_01025 [Sulfolobales archaeon]
MKLLSRGLTKVTASISLSIIVIITSILTWTLITSATPNINYITIQQLPKIESVMYNEQNNELIINIRSNSYNAVQYQVSIYKANGTVLEEIPTSIVALETLNTNLIVVTVKLNTKMVTCSEYVLQLIVNNKIVKEYLFKL